MFTRVIGIAVDDRIVSRDERVSVDSMSEEICPVDQPASLVIRHCPRAGRDAKRQKLADITAV